MNIDGKTALVTGAAGGIGRALVLELLDNGASKIIACDLDRKQLNDIAARDTRVVPQELDVTDEAEVARVAAAHGDVDLLINCHGIVVHENYLAAATLGAFRKEMDVNYWGQLLLCRAFAPVVNRNAGGAIVNFLSPLAFVTFPFCAAYCATKAACRVLTDAMRAELGPKGVLVMAVCPGTIDTGMMSNLDIPKSPPEGVAKAVVEGLSSDETEVWAGEGAQDMRQRLRDDPEALQAEAAKWLRLEQN
ncbi:SDR family NAD(P)-dependent oxidoreductase [Sphingomonas sp. LaA6.9]|uniref:SDR family NAD(P)-dependent oxidoreductase n=1 Tax=Sphingomonas sp. LaA6.9 TaxID=2919914 RepID=UPI001F4FFA46|nr:SDR family NAD(P)-dependent oxidoreductase [Sphingomonas sp. LaA6.9]MCJ8159008.1 SDR family NAD(P)-dependent oxidoreductase [Sphingomonas sp. LaA6.9]